MCNGMCNICYHNVFECIDVRLCGCSALGGLALSSHQIIDRRENTLTVIVEYIIYSLNGFSGYWTNWFEIFYAKNVNFQTTFTTSTFHPPAVYYSMFAKSGALIMGLHVDP